MASVCEVAGHDLCAIVTWWSHHVAALGTFRPQQLHRTPNTGFGDAVREAADRLPIKQAEAVWLVDVCGLSYADAASAAGVSRDTLARRLHRARRFIVASAGPRGTHR